MTARIAFALAACLALFLAGCGKAEVTAYEVPKEAPPRAPYVEDLAAPAGSMPAAHPPMAGSGMGQMPPSMSMADQSLPAEALGQTAAPRWEVPAGWIDGRQTATRRGSYTVAGATDVDISVTSFPGDVGGLAANINRWRGQIGLAPLPGAQAEAHASALEIAGLPGQWVDISGPQLRTLAGIVMRDGVSWFFKMTGPLDAVAAQEAPLRAFLASVRFE
jgi:hypothetical protein